MIKREAYLKRIRPFIGKDVIKVFTGMRRSGKSVMLDLIKDELLKHGVDESQVKAFNFEDLENEQYLDYHRLHEAVRQFCKNLKGQKAYIFLDEIQEVVGWEKCVNSLRSTSDCDLYITGSNAKLLSSELSTLLSGRYVEFPIYPFSFSEFLLLIQETYPNISLDDAFARYLELGGLPYLANLDFNREASRQYLRDIYETIVLKDVVRRAKIRDVDLLSRIIRYLIVNDGSPFSSSSISKFFKSERRTVSPDTILNYVRHCCDAYLFHIVPREDVCGKTVLASLEKYYFADIGIREALTGRNQTDIGLTLENIVGLELLRRGYEIRVGKFGDREIDFIGIRGNEKIYIQVAYLLATNDVVKREFASLLTIRDNYPKYVLSMDKMDFSHEGVVHRNIIDWLLEEKWLRAKLNAPSRG